MFKDLALSRDSMSEYHSKLPENSPGCKMNALVLQRSAWPFAVLKNTVDLPPTVRPRIFDLNKPAHWILLPDASRVDKV